VADVTSLLLEQPVILLLSLIVGAHGAALQFRQALELDPDADA
jgi:hypothetical protein